jgi:cytochrome b involved in lipid metabolism
MRARIPTPRSSQLSKAQSDAKHLPRPYKLRRYYLPSELAIHNTKDDCWVSFFGQVFDLTRLLQDNFTSELCDPIVLAAGTDISHWFDQQTRDVSFLNKSKHIGFTA